MLLATVAAGYLSGVLAFQFANAVQTHPQPVLVAARESANLQYFIAAAIMVLSLVIALSAARVVLTEMGASDPIRTLRGPLILVAIGAILTLVLAVPGVFLLLIAGLAWLTYRILSESIELMERRPVEQTYLGQM